MDVSISNNQYIQVKNQQVEELEKVEISSLKAVEKKRCLKRMFRSLMRYDQEVIPGLNEKKKQVKKLMKDLEKEPLRLTLRPKQEGGLRISFDNRSVKIHTENLPELLLTLGIATSEELEKLCRKTEIAKKIGIDNAVNLAIRISLDVLFVQNEEFYSWKYNTQSRKAHFENAVESLTAEGYMNKEQEKQLKFQFKFSPFSACVKLEKPMEEFKEGYVTELVQSASMVRKLLEIRLEQINQILEEEKLIQDLTQLAETNAFLLLDKERVGFIYIQTAKGLIKLKGTEMHMV